MRLVYRQRGGMSVVFVARWRRGGSALASMLKFENLLFDFQRECREGERLLPH